jgi:glycosyltransferase involved in cell wall biosynthesis
MAFEKNIATVTIVTRSFIPFARILLGSIRKNYPTMPLYVLLLDKIEGDCSCGEGVEVVPVSELALPELENMLSRYSNTEMCVALKPFAVKEIFRRTNNAVEGVIYMDSDIFVVSAMKELEDLVNAGEQIIITPHLNKPSTVRNTTDLVMLKCGVYNMGFAYFANTSSAHFILDWWGGWLKYHCYEDFNEGLFGDQKWMDLLTCYTDDYKILRDDGYNVAYWNIDQRPVTRRDGQWFAAEAPLRFLHLSCPAIEPEPLFSRNLDRYDAGNIGELSQLVAKYAEKVLAAGLREYKDLPVLLRTSTLTRKDVRLPVHAPAGGPMPKSAKLLCAGLSLPLAILMNVLNPREVIQIVKTFAKAFLGCFLSYPEHAYWWLQRQNAFCRFLAENPFLLAMHIKRKSRNIPSVFAEIKKDGIGNVLTAVRGMLTPPSPSPNTILVTDVRVPHHDMIAADLTTFNLLKDLVRFGYAVTFLPWGSPWPDRYATDLRRLGVILDYSPELHGSSKDYVERFGAKFAAFYLQPMGLAAELVPVIRDVDPDAKIVFHAADVCFVREQREAQLKQDKTLLQSAAKTKKQELDLIRKVDHLVVISDKEKEFIAAELGHATPISSFTCLYSKCLANPAPFENRNGVIFIGVFGHRPNVDAVLWFTREVWPSVRKKNSSIVFHVVGNYAPPEIQELDGKDGIIIEGFVENLDPLLASVRVAVAPLRYGAGIKGKIGTTMGAGVPNICTSIATEGMGIENEKQALVADNPEDFAAAVLRLHSEPNLWQTLSLAGLEMVQSQYSEEAGTKQFKQVLRNAGLWLKKEDNHA